MAKEINLVPDIKDEFIKALKFRNFMFFLSIVVAASSLVIILIFLSISGGQQGFIASKQKTIDALNDKINSYSDLSDFLTIRDQLGNISTITENKLIMSRTFNILSAIIPTGADYINISELSVDLAEEVPAFNFEAQANAGAEPQIDYRVLDAFKKSMAYMRYDYGEYVDKNDNPIPAYCIIETNADGGILRDSSKGYYAYWLIRGEGCNPSAENTEDEEDLDADTNEDEEPVSEDIINAKKAAAAEAELAKIREDYALEQLDGQDVVRIWRTPQFTEWYKAEPKEDEAYMDLDGNIHNMAHFNSSCIKYSGTEAEDGKNITWSTSNESCKLITSSEGNEEGIIIRESSNGRDSNESLVLRFTATINFTPDVFNFNNHHMLALPPSGRLNVTDSYAQIQSMFAERASDCAKDDAACFTTPTSADTDSTNNKNNEASENNENNENNEDNENSGNEEEEP